MSTIRDTINEERERQGLSVYALATMVAVKRKQPGPTRAVADWLTGRSDGRCSIAEDCAAALGLRIIATRRANSK